MTHPVLDLPMRLNDAGAETIRDYLKALLTNLWIEGEDFGSKRPFGNSGWAFEIYDTLAEHDLIEVTVNKWGEYEYEDGALRDGDFLIRKAIEDL